MEKYHCVMVCTLQHLCPVLLTNQGFDGSNVFASSIVIKKFSSAVFWATARVAPFSAS
jgi:hypothetical protein